MSNCTTIAVDLAKNVFQVTEADANNRPLRRRRLNRHRFREFLAKHEPVTVLMEACGTAHYWARIAQQFGHRPKLLPPNHVKRFVLRDKTDHIDTLALLSANDHPRVKPVPPKTEYQQTLMALHRLRAGLMKTRQGRICAARGVLAEIGIFLPRGARKFLSGLTRLLHQPDSPIPAALRTALAESLAEIREHEKRIASIERQLRALAREDEVIARLRSLPGIGLLIATAMRAYIGDFSRFPSGRHLAAYLGITPKESSSAHRRVLGPISKRGNRYLRFLLIQGARAALRSAKLAERPDRLQAWACALEARTCYNHAAVALANKLSRIAWAVVTRQTTYQRRPAA